MAENKKRFAGANNPVAGLPFFTEPTDTGAESAASNDGVKSVGRPKKEGIQRDRGAGKGLQEGSTRYTVIFQVETMEFLQDYAYTKRTTIKEALTMMIDKFKAEYEADPNNEALLPDPKYIEKRKGSKEGDE